MRTDLRRLTRSQRVYVLAYRRAYYRAGIEYREELALLADAHKREMAKLAAFYDDELKSLSGDFALLAAAHREELRRRAVDEALAEKAAAPFGRLH